MGPGAAHTLLCLSLCFGGSCWHSDQESGLALNPEFSTCVHQNQLEGSSKYRLLGPTSRVSESVGLG
jgi:hypothetical protein